MPQALGERGPRRTDVDELYRRSSTWLMERLRRRFGTELAEDLVQEAFLRVTRYDRAAEVRHPRALLLQIAINLGVDLGRRAARERAAVGPEMVGGSPPAQLDGLLLREVVLSLPEPLRDVFVLSRFAGLTYNAGPHRVARLGRVPAIPETQNYVAAVVDCYLALSAGRSVRSSRECVSGGRIRP
jgi:RNA polymerase sigma-70 factor (ECF subfamily)